VAKVDEQGRELARSIVRQWKMNRSLYRRYGGVVVYQQLDPLEPIGAYKALLEEMRRRKIFEIFDRGLADGFWARLSDRSFEIPPDQVDFETPFWLKAPPPDEATGPRAATGPSDGAALTPPEGCTVADGSVRFVFDPGRFEHATNGITGERTELRTLRVETACLAGDFNEWSPSAWVMRPVGPTGSLYVLERRFDELGGSGTHEFKFVVNGTWWVEPGAGSPNRRSTGLSNRSSNLELVIPSPAEGAGSGEVWTNIDQNTDDITRVVVYPAAGSWRIHVWGRCRPTDCDWGENVATAMAGGERRFTATWNRGFAIRTMTLELRGDGVLVVRTQSHFTDESGRDDYESVSYLRRR
jgi:hypothetical protein